MARLTPAAFTQQPWRIHEIAGDFAVEDVWAFRAPGAGSDDFQAMVNAIRAAGGSTTNLPWGGCCSPCAGSWAPSWAGTIPLRASAPG
ncbi:hypothetical protein ACFQZC_38115 [Streptacidiphilus monticola]